MNLTAAFMQVADPHLLKMDTILGVFDAKITAPAAQTVIDGLDGGRNFLSGPVGVAMIGHDAAQVLKVFIFIFNLKVL